jgi:lipopolysaccharide/colanic/teichoic acid biosynthesis glycosyltransferase
MAKRLLDVTVSAAALVMLSPLLAIIAAAIRLDSPGPAIYRGRRVGRGGQEFDILKFRTMVQDAEQAGPGITTGDDARVTRMGRWLRSARLDELPQLVNILRGEMSLVGPRPEAPAYVALYDEKQRLALTVRPGLTSPAAIRFRHEEHLLTGDDWERRYVEEIMPAKLAMDLDYIRRSSFASDLHLLVQTVLAVWFRRESRD